MIAPARPYRCCSEHCCCERDSVPTGYTITIAGLTDVGLCESEQELDAQEPQPRGWRAWALGALVLCGAVGAVWFTLFVCGVR